ncbi:Cross-pathway control protein 1 [Cytospora mali]|uniref:Cross-pathway control protein 1 n=1 Tax=Cytospora mali TaxID=578113 RepID=A0A194VEB4_CYTMA|nr:Cross-pathway control protein 1 [Valsa mali var. pyri (nom. inval.)]
MDSKEDQTMIEGVTTGTRQQLVPRHDRPSSSTSFHPDPNSFLNDNSYHHQDPLLTTGTGLDSDFLSPDLWSQLCTTGDTPETISTSAQDPSTFGQLGTWTTSGEAFSAVPSLALDFNFDPALIEALPDSTNIPDFFIDTPQQPPSHSHSHTNTQHHMLTPPQAFISNSTGTQSSAPSPTDSSPRPGDSTTRASGAGRQPAKTQEDPDTVLKRQRNTIAARKYRQKRLDRVKELEDALESMTQERDDLKLRLARQEAETAALKEMMRMKSGQDSGSN